MKENKIEILITTVKREVAVPWVLEFKVKIKNSLDNIKTWPNNNSDDIPSYLNRSDLEELLSNIQQNVKKTLIGYTPGVIIKTGESWDD